MKGGEGALVFIIFFALAIAAFVVFLLLGKKTVNQQSATTVMSIDEIAVEREEVFESIIGELLEEYFQNGLNTEIDIMELMGKREIYLMDEVISSKKIEELLSKMLLYDMEELYQFLKRCRGKKFRSAEAKRLLEYLELVIEQGQPLCYFKLSYPQNDSKTWFEALFEFLSDPKTEGMLSEQKKETLSHLMENVAAEYQALTNQIHETIEAISTLEEFKKFLKTYKGYIDAYL